MENNKMGSVTKEYLLLFISFIGFIVAKPVALRVVTYNKIIDQPGIYEAHKKA